MRNAPIADLLCHGLLRSSFVPPQPVRELRDLTRYRRKLVESQSAERNHLLKLLETANIKLGSVASDVFGVSGLLMLHALVEGKATPQEMAELAKRRLRNKIPELELALEGRVEEHHRFLLKLQLDRLESVDKDLAVLEQRMQENWSLMRRSLPYWMKSQVWTGPWLRSSSRNWVWT